MQRLLKLFIPLVVVAGLAAGCSSDDGKTAATPAPKNAPEVVIGVQDFGESKILAEIYAQALEGQGYKVKRQDLGGYRDVVYTAFASKNINFTPEYAASALEFLNQKKGEATSDAAATTQKLQTYLKAKKLTALTPSSAVDTNVFVVTKATSEKVKSLADLTPEMRLGGPADCPTNPFCIGGLKSVYGVDLSSKFVPLDGGGPNTKKALENGSVDVAVLFSTDGSIADKGWVVLEDPKHLALADNIVPVVSDSLLSAGGDDLTKTVNEVSEALDTTKLTAMNKEFDVDKRDAADIATDFLASNGLK